MTDETAKPVVNFDDVDGFPFGDEAGNFEATLKQIGRVIGTEKLGCMLTEVAPGKRAFPYHAHHANEEMFVVLEGTGEYRLGAGRHGVRAGDVLAAPAGGPETAHQIINTGDVTLKYLAISTKHDPEVVEYPDSDKFATISRFDFSDPDAGGIRFIGRTADTLEYFDGETGEK